MNNKDNTLVAVYGSLRKGMHNNSVLPYDAVYLCETTAKAFKMYDYGAFPFISPTDNTDDNVVIEVYEVEIDDLLGGLDMLEGYPSFYNRQKIDTPLGLAWIYFIDYEDVSKYKEVEGGDWVKYMNKNKAHYNTID